MLKLVLPEATLLNMLNISPFTYGMSVVQVYDNGQVFPSSILDITDDELISHFVSAINTIASISLAAGYPTLPSVGHSIINNYKNVLALSVATDYTYEGSEAVKDRLANPEAYAAAAPAAAAAGGAAEKLPLKKLLPMKKNLMTTWVSVYSIKRKSHDCII